MFQFPPESDECNYHDRLQMILAQFSGEGAFGTNEIGKNLQRSSRKSVLRGKGGLLSNRTFIRIDFDMDGSERWG